MSRECINYFSGDHAFLSNFYPCAVLHEGIVYPSSENAFQAAKSLNMDARKVFALKEVTPGMSKHLGRAIVLRPNWDTIKLVVMCDILAAKFSDPALRKLLIETGDAELIEGNTWGDTFWGVCNGKGSNFLGKSLMDLRKKLTAVAS
jgi:ribA/ribD-fused uncharacterized protein